MDSLLRVDRMSITLGVPQVIESALPSLTPARLEQRLRHSEMWSKGSRVLTVATLQSDKLLTT
jgi:hypothetical protein